MSNFTKSLKNKSLFSFIVFSFFIQHLNCYVTYSEVEAEQFLNLAAAAYADAGNTTARQSCIDISYPDTDFYVTMVMSSPCDKNSNQCQAFVAISDTTKQVIISFRGTNSGGQLLTEFANGLEDYVSYEETDSSMNNVTVGYVNTYFLKAMRQMWEDMVYPSIVERKAYEFLITGHSLGGAMATLTAFRISFRNISTRIKVHTFGEPRVGDISFAKNFNAMVPYAFRVVHATDPVPHLPPLYVGNPSENGKPYHHPREIWYNNDFTNYVLCSETDGEDWNCSDKERFWSYGNQGAYRHTHYFNHFLSEYGALGCNTGPHMFLISNSYLLILNFSLFIIYSIK